MDRDEIERWVSSYERLWRTAGTDGLREIFTENATYSTSPYEDPHRGLEAIERMWDAERDGPGEDFTISSEVVAVEGDTGVVRVYVRYGPPKDQEYRDLWVIALGEDGRCVSFEEWPFWPPGSEGTAAGGAQMHQGARRPT